ERQRPTRLAPLRESANRFSRGESLGSDFSASFAEGAPGAPGSGAFLSWAGSVFFAGSCEKRKSGSDRQASAAILLDLMGGPLRCPSGAELEHLHAVVAAGNVGPVALDHDVLAPALRAEELLEGGVG